VASKRPRVEPPLIYLDSDVYLDWLLKRSVPHRDTGEPRWQSAVLMIDATGDGRARLAASALIEAEVACQGDVRTGDRRVRAEMRELFQAPATLWTDVDRFLVRDAIDLAAKYGMRGADATHLAAAIRLECDYLMSHDGKFPFGQTVQGVQVIRPAVVWEPTLLELVVDEEEEPA